MQNIMKNHNQRLIIEEGCVRVFCAYPSFYTLLSGWAIVSAIKASCNEGYWVWALRSTVCSVGSW